MAKTVLALAPEIAAHRQWSLTGSARTFARFTRREAGWVGGVPRRAGLSAYRDLAPRPIEDGLYLVGDTVFPGQSTLAAAVGGHRVATALLGTAAGGWWSRPRAARAEATATVPSADPQFQPLS
jgi:phytoene dehydrogenase-like protein